METEKNIAAISDIEKDAFTTAGNEAEEIISAKPPLWVRWGIVYLFIVLLLVIVIAWLIQYPDTVQTKGVLVSINAPKEVIVEMNGKLLKLLVKEGQPVAKGEIIGHLESNADFNEVLRLSEIIDGIQNKINKGNSNEVINYTSSVFNNLGELQTYHQVFSTALAEFVNYLGKGFYLRKKRMLQGDIGYMQRLHSELQTQKRLLSNDLALTDSTFRVNETLKDEKIISAIDYRNEKSKLIARQMTLPQINSSIITNESQQHDKGKEIAELENQIEQQKRIFVQALNTLKSQIEEWKRKYVLSAPVDGTVSYNTFLQENQELKAGESVCFITPENTGYYVEALLSQYNFGKVKQGQDVLLNFTAYPSREFGTVKGIIGFIASVPSDSGYLAKISLPKGLVTNRNRELKYRTGLTLQGEIITEKKRLLQRLFDNLKSNRN